jgi:hypothetical protein
VCRWEIGLLWTVHLGDVRLPVDLNLPTSPIGLSLSPSSSSPPAALLLSVHSDVIDKLPSKSQCWSKSRLIHSLIVLDVSGAHRQTLTGKEV